jgi:hypothetical protein
MKYNKGDIVICSHNKVNSYEYNLIVGGKYEVIGYMLIHGGGNDGFSKVALDVRKCDNNDNTVQYMQPDNLFITLDVYREFQLRKILE